MDRQQGKSALFQEWVHMKGRIVMAKKMFINLGQNLVRQDGTGILADAKKVFSEPSVLVVLHLENDRLLEGAKALLPEGTEFLAVRKDGTIVGDQPQVGVEDVFVLNGGRTAQNHAMQTLALLGGEIWDLQPAPEPPVKLAPLIPSSEKARKQLLENASSAYWGVHTSASDVEWAWWGGRDLAMDFLQMTKEELLKFIRGT